MRRSPTLLIYTALFGILIFAWITRTYRLHLPAEYVFDERYHVPAIRLIAEGDPRAFEWWHPPIYGNDNHDWLHPPLAKYIQAGFFTAFGGDAFSWRIAAAVFGVIGVVLVFLVTQLAFGRRVLSLLAALLLSLDGLWLVQSRVAMNDVFAAVWLLAAAAVYLWYRRTLRPEWLLLIGVIGGLGMATKWSAVFWLGGLLIWEVLPLVNQKVFKKLPWVMFTLVIVPAMVYVASYVPFFLQGKNMTDFIDLHKNILSYELYRGGSHPAQSGPGQWLINSQPVWYWQGGENQHIFAFNNPLLALLEVGAVCFVLGRLLRSKLKKSAETLSFLIMIFAVSFLPWLVSPRLLFYYHYTPAVPLVAIFLAYWLAELYLYRVHTLAKIAFFIIAISLVWVFWLYYPFWIGLPVSAAFSQAVYFAMPQL